MSLQFIIGRAGSGKTSHCLEEIRKQLEKEPNGPPLIYLVPEQMTFQAEYELVRSPNLSGMIRAQVYSFTRLAWRVLQETGGLARKFINRTGIHMLLRKILENNQERLQVFQGAKEQTGFIEQLEEMIKECKQYCITPADLAQTYQAWHREGEEREQTSLLLAKLHDLELVYSQLEESLRNHFLATEDYLHLLAEKIGESVYLEEAQIWVDGFHQFTPQEILVLKALLEHCQKVRIALTLDPDYLHPSGELKSKPHELDLFYPTAKTYDQLYRMAREMGVPVKTPLFLPQEEGEVLPRFREQPMLAHLEKQYDRWPLVPYRNNQLDEQEVELEKQHERKGIRLLAAVHARAEVEAVAQEIIRLARDHGYRYREMAIMVRNGEDYYDLLETVFSDYDLPLFLDQKRSMLFHPLIEFIRSSLDVVRGGWRYDAVFRCVKTDLFCPLDQDMDQWREKMDKLENYVLAHGIYGSQWTDGKPWAYRSFHTLEEEEKDSKADQALREEVNRLKEAIRAPLIFLQKGLAEAKNVREMCAALFAYLEQVEVSRKLEAWRDASERAGKLEEARQHDQVWTAVLELLDQMVEMLGEEQVSLSLFAKLVESGLESMHFSLVPPALDQVVVASIGRSRLSPEIKCVFLLGVNDGVIPARPESDGLLTEEERALLAEKGVELSPGSMGQLAEEPFLIYHTLSSASHQLWISYPLADQEGKALLPSKLIQRLKDLFPDLKEELILAEPETDSADSAEPLRFLSRPGPALAHVGRQLHEWKKGEAISSLWWDVYSWFRTKPEWQELSARRLAGLFYLNQENRLKRETSRSLYGQHVQVSVSRMERFSACPFSQFLSHGLKLKERPVYRLAAPDIGQLFHAALKLIAEELWQKQRHWAELSKEECFQLASEIVDRLAPRLQSEILLSTSRNQYILRKLKQVVGRTSHVLSQQAKRSGFSPIGIELSFGGKRGRLPSLSFVLENGSTLELIGRIDRVDQAESSQGLLLRVIDYKSSETNVSLAEIYYGLALQMLTYLEVLIQNAKYLVGREVIPAGILYFHVHNPLISSNKPLSPAQLEAELFKSFKMKGFVLADPEVARLMDTELTTKHSPVIPVGLKADGSFYANSSVISLEELNVLRKHVRKVIRQMGKELTDGIISIAPYKLARQVACTYCPYRPVCQFDPMLEGNEYRYLFNDKKDVLLARMMQEGELRDE